MIRRQLGRLAVVLLVLACAVPVLAQTSIAGRWEGAITVMGQDLGIVVVFTDVGPAISATIDIPQQGARGIPLRNVRAAGGRVHFELPAGPGLAVFEGTVAGDVMSGSFTQGPANGHVRAEARRRAQAGAAPALPAGRSDDPERRDRPGRHADGPGHAWRAPGGRAHHGQRAAEPRRGTVRHQAVPDDRRPPDAGGHRRAALRRPGRRRLDGQRPEVDDRRFRGGRARRGAVSSRPVRTSTRRTSACSDTAKAGWWHRWPR